MKKEKLLGLAATTVALTAAIAPIQAEARGCAPRVAPVRCAPIRGGAMHRAPMHHAPMYRAPVYHRPVRYTSRYYGGYYGSRPYYGGYWRAPVVVGGYYSSYNYAVSTPVVVQQPVVQQPVYQQPAPVVPQPVYQQPAPQPVVQAQSPEVKVVVEHRYVVEQAAQTNQIENVRQ